MKNYILRLDEMVGRYSTEEEIDCVELKRKFKNQL
jgi:hypothetical protein